MDVCLQQTPLTAPPYPCFHKDRSEMHCQRKGSSLGGSIRSRIRAASTFEALTVQTKGFVRERCTLVANAIDCSL